MTNKDEIFINELSYDMEIFKVILQITLINLFEKNSNNPLKTAEAIKQQASEVLLASAIPENQIKIQEFVKMRLEKFFQSIEKVLKERKKP